MKLLPSFLTGIVVLGTMSVVMAVEPPTNTPSPAQSPAGKTDAKTPPAAAKTAAANPAPAPAPAAPAAPVSIGDEYFNTMVSTLNLSDSDKKAVEDLYLKDQLAVQAIGNNASLSPLQQSQQIADLREKRNEKVEAILHNLDRQHMFRQVEACYRIAWTEYALNTPPLAPTPAPASAPATPAASTNAAPAAPAATAPAK